MDFPDPPKIPDSKAKPKPLSWVKKFVFQICEAIAPLLREKLIPSGTSPANVIYKTVLDLSEVSSTSAAQWSDLFLSLALHQNKDEECKQFYRFMALKKSLAEFESFVQSKSQTCSEVLEDLNHSVQLEWPSSSPPSLPASFESSFQASEIDGGSFPQPSFGDLSSTEPEITSGALMPAEISSPAQSSIVSPSPRLLGAQREIRPPPFSVKIQPRQSIPVNGGASASPQPKDNLLVSIAASRFEFSPSRLRPQDRFDSDRNPKDFVAGSPLLLLHSPPQSPKLPPPFVVKLKSRSAATTTAQSSPPVSDFLPKTVAPASPMKSALLTSVATQRFEFSPTKSRQQTPTKRSGGSGSELLTQNGTPISVTSVTTSPAAAAAAVTLSNRPLSRYEQWLAEQEHRLVKMKVGQPKKAVDPVAKRANDLERRRSVSKSYTRVGDDRTTSPIRNFSSPLRSKTPPASARPRASTTSSPAAIRTGKTERNSTPRSNSVTRMPSPLGLKSPLQKPETPKMESSQPPPPPTAEPSPPPQPLQLHIAQQETFVDESQLEGADEIEISDSDDEAENDLRQRIMEAAAEAEAEETFNSLLQEMESVPQQNADSEIETQSENGSLLVKISQPNLNMPAKEENLDAEETENSEDNSGSEESDGGRMSEWWDVPPDPSSHAPSGTQEDVGSAPPAISPSNDNLPLVQNLNFSDSNNIVNISPPPSDQSVDNDNLFDDKITTSEPRPQPENPRPSETPTISAIASGVLGSPPPPLNQNQEHVLVFEETDGEEEEEEERESVPFNYEDEFSEIESMSTMSNHSDRRLSLPPAPQLAPPPLAPDPLFRLGLRSNAVVLPSQTFAPNGFTPALAAPQSPPKITTDTDQLPGNSEFLLDAVCVPSSTLQMLPITKSVVPVPATPRGREEQITLSPQPTQPKAAPSKPTQPPKNVYLQVLQNSGGKKATTEPPKTTPRSASPRPKLGPNSIYHQHPPTPLHAVPTQNPRGQVAVPPSPDLTRNKAELIQSLAASGRLLPTDKIKGPPAPSVKTLVAPKKKV